MHSKASRWAKPASRLGGTDIGALVRCPVARTTLMRAKAITNRAIGVFDPLRARVPKLASTIGMHRVLFMSVAQIPCQARPRRFGRKFVIVDDELC